MWKRKEESSVNPVVNPIKEVTRVSTLPQERKIETGHETAKTTMAHIGKSVLIKGELSGSEDLYIDGKVEGTIELREHNLSIGPNGQVHANINAKEVVIQGSVKGDVLATDRVEIKKSGSLRGDLVAARVVIEDGAYFKGSIDIQKGEETATKPAQPKKADTPRNSDPANKYPGGVPVETKQVF
ncbi:MAG: polymer-forming cytoskeletal protein [Acidobacteria bacterium]|nr:polymer-forming cytoskeletal protein [Acidobacteriota bacterium]